MASRVGGNLSKMIRNLKKVDYIVTNEIESWLVNNPDLLITDDDLAFIKSVATPYGTRQNVWTGSQAGKCERAQVFRWIGVPVQSQYNPGLINIFHDGTWRHVRWQIMLAKVFPEFVAEVPVQSDELHVLGSLDGHMPRVGIEIKGTSQFHKVTSGGILPGHEDQAYRYWIASDDDPRFVEPIEQWVFIYEDKGTQRWKEIILDRDPKVEQRVRRELRRLNYAVDQQELPDIQPACKQGKGYVFKQCAYSSQCLTIKNWNEAQSLCSNAGGSTSGGVAVAKQPVAITGMARGRRKLAQHRG